MKPLPKPRVRERWRRCYEIAGRVVFEQPAFVLVHGVCRYTDLDIGKRVELLPFDHAWVVDPADGMVYDPVQDRWYDDEEAYTGARGAVVIARYTLAEAAKALLEGNHWGPWVDPQPTILRM